MKDVGPACYAPLGLRDEGTFELRPQRTGESVRFRLHRMRSLMPGPVATTLILLGLVLVAFVAGSFLPDPRSIMPPLATLILFVFFAPFVVRISAKPVGETFAELTDRVLRMPPAISSKRIDEVPLEQIIALMLRGEDRHGIVYAATSKKNYVLPLNAFMERGGGALFHEELRARIRALPGGEAQLASIDDRNTESLRAFEVKCIATQLVLVALVMIFFAEQVGHAFDNEIALMRFGANSRALVFDGQWYRLFSASFLHGNEVHIVMNAIGIFSLGFIIERLLGTPRFVFIYLFSALTGAAASIIFPRAGVSVGASTAVCGLLAAFAYLQLRHARKIPAGFHQPLRTWAWVLGLNVLLPFFVPQIDWLAHLGGFAGGLIATYLVTSAEDHFPLQPAPRGQLVAVGVLSLVFLAGLARAAENVTSEDREWIEIIGKSEYGPDILNAIAWSLVVKPGPTPKNDLELALEAGERSLALETDEKNREMVRDTVASLAHRLGDDERAVRLELQVLEARRNEFTATQLARFAAAHFDREHAPLDLAGTSSTTTIAPGLFYVGRTSESKIAGLIAVRKSETPIAPTSWPKDTKLDPVLEAPLRFDPRVWNADPEALDLP